MLRLAAGSALVCVASWFALQAAAGGIGLQRSISKGAVTLFEQPATITIVGATAFGVAYLVASRMRLGPLPLLLGVLLGDAFAGVVLAPLAVGELQPVDAPLVFAAVSVLGIQPAAALAGAWAGSLRSRDIHQR